ncbi:hypothetical protein LO762_05945 [Actinocorallia sp. API 0066]|uniref:hypothetical protein n=1 Tax=Actinocorallia sp. API 0066 TaxID=2896846 RepID=UPI001E30617E|nr:hypothetical protein [Actinocorallia sp. API 0066]MCD0448738.1 hypothetical protein [Actinocorallia sp. API 0066]
MTERRIAVTSPRTGAARRRPGGGSKAREIDEQTRLGEVYMDALIRSQLKLSLSVCVVLVTFVGGLPLVFALADPVRESEVFGVPLPWLLLAVVVYPVFGALGWWYRRQAERTERDFVDMVERR